MARSRWKIVLGSVDQRAQPVFAGLHLLHAQRQVSRHAVDALGHARELQGAMRRQAPAQVALADRLGRLAHGRRQGQEQQPQPAAQARFRPDFGDVFP